MADINILEWNEVVATTWLSDINWNFEELNVKKIELEWIAVEMLDTDYFTIKKSDDKFYLISKADANIWGWSGWTPPYTYWWDICDFTFTNATGNDFHTIIDPLWNIYLSKMTSNFDWWGSGISLVKIDPDLNILSYSLIRYSPSVWTKWLFNKGIEYLNWNIYIVWSVNTDSLNPIQWSSHWYTAVFIKIDPDTLNILSNECIVLTLWTSRYLTPSYVIKQWNTQMWIRLYQSSSRLLCIYDTWWSINVYLINNNTNNDKYLLNWIWDFIWEYYDSSISRYVYFFWSTLIWISYTTSFPFTKLINDWVNYYWFWWYSNRLHKLNNLLEPLASININTWSTEYIYDIIIDSNYIYVLSVDSSSTATNKTYIFMFNTSDLSFYKKIEITTLLSTKLFDGNPSISDKLHIFNWFLYMIIAKSEVNWLSVFKIPLDPALWDYLTQPAKKTNMYNVIISTTYTPEAWTVLVKDTDITVTTQAQWISYWTLWSSLLNTANSISQVKLEIWY